MTVRAKFVVDSLTQYRFGGEAKLTVVTSGSDENKSFWKYTPAGQITMHIDNEDALKQFVPGAEYYVDFTKAETEAGV